MRNKIILIKKISFGMMIQSRNYNKFCELKDFAIKNCFENLYRKDDVYDIIVELNPIIKNQQLKIKVSETIFIHLLER